MGVTFLGPQRRPTVDRVVRSLGADGPVAAVTAGWQERESDDAELDEQLDGRSENLRLYARWGDVQERDREFAAAVRRRREELLELRHTYLIRLGHALAAVHDLAPDAEERIEVAAANDIDRPGPSRRSTARAAAWGRAIDDVRRIDAEHLRTLDERNDDFIARWLPHEREAVAQHRAEVADCLERAAVLALAGGHIGVLLALLHLFAVDPPRRLSIVAWSAGAMCLTERVVLYHDRTVQGPSDPEVYGRGLSVVRDTVAMPHARARLLLDDEDRMTAIGARFAPARCLLLDTGARLAVGFEGVLPPSAVVLGADGRATTAATATA